MLNRILSLVALTLTSAVAVLGVVASTPHDSVHVAAPVVQVQLKLTATGVPAAVLVSADRAPSATDAFVVPGVGRATPAQRADVLQHLPSGAWTHGQWRPLAQ